MRQRHRRTRKERRRQEPRPWSERLIDAGVIALLVFTPLAYGTVEPWAEAITALIILGIAVTWVASMLRQWELRLDLPPAWWSALLFLILVIVQSLALPGILVQLASPGAAALYHEAWAITGGEAGTMALSLDPEATRRMALKLLMVALLLLVVYNTCRTHGQIRRIVWVMIVMGTLISLFGIIQRMTWNGRLYWLGPEAPVSYAFGPFVNRTHFAGFIVTVVPLALALALAGWRDPRRHRQARSDWRERLRVWNSQQAGPASLIPWLVLLMGGAALVSGSRGGLLALLMALVIMGGLSARGPSGVGRAWRVALATMLIVLTALWIGGDMLYGTVERLAEELGQPEESPRLHIWADAIQLWRQFPIFGTGLGTFGVAFPMVRSIQAPVAFTHAESDWVQLLTDTGVTGALLAVLALGITACALMRRYRNAEDRWTRTIAQAGLVVLAGTAIQGIANYNLPVMSNLIYAALAVALSLRAGEIEGPGETVPAVTRTRSPARSGRLMATADASTVSPQDDRASVTH